MSTGFTTDTGIPAQQRFGDYLIIYARMLHHNADVVKLLRELAEFRQLGLVVGNVERALNDFLTLADRRDFARTLGNVDTYRNHSIPPGLFGFAACVYK
jgi:hypothetical protein